MNEWMNELTTWGARELTASLPLLTPTTQWHYCDNLATWPWTGTMLVDTAESQKNQTCPMLCKCAILPKRKLITLWMWRATDHHPHKLSHVQTPVSTVTFILHQADETAVNYFICMLTLAW